MKKRYTVTFPDELWEKMEAKRKSLDISRSELVNRALAAYFAKRGYNLGTPADRTPSPAESPAKPAGVNPE